MKPQWLAVLLVESDLLEFDCKFPIVAYDFGGPGVLSVPEQFPGRLKVRSNACQVFRGDITCSFSVG